MWKKKGQGRNIFQLFLPGYFEAFSCKTVLLQHLHYFFYNQHFLIVQNQAHYKMEYMCDWSIYLANMELNINSFKNARVLYFMSKTVFAMKMTMQLSF